MESLANNQALLQAVDRNDAAAVRSLLANGANPNYRDIFDRTTALHQAAIQGNLEIAKMLIEAGADVQSSENDADSSPLGVALIAGKLEFVKMLVAKKARLAPAEVGTGILDEARSLGYEEAAKAIEAQLSVN